MPLSITGKPLDFCPEHCLMMCVEINEENYYCDTRKYLTVNEVSCKYESVCEHAYQLGKKA